MPVWEKDKGTWYGEADFNAVMFAEVALEMIVSTLCCSRLSYSALYL